MTGEQADHVITTVKRLCARYARCPQRSPATGGAMTQPRKTLAEGSLARETVSFLPPKHERTGS
jgi:hypothetical protein